jgi:hypothetical protein
MAGKRRKDELPVQDRVAKKNNSKSKSPYVTVDAVPQTKSNDNLRKKAMPVSVDAEEPDFPRGERSFSCISVLYVWMVFLVDDSTY